MSNLVGDAMVQSMNDVIGNFLTWSPVIYVVMIVLGIFVFELILGVLVRAIQGSSAGVNTAPMGMSGSGRAKATSGGSPANYLGDD